MFARHQTETLYPIIYLGFGQISRAEVIENHTRPLAQTLFGSGLGVILVLDETYIYLQKR